jgi:hypothetical protein
VNWIAMFFPGKPTNSQLMAKWVAPDNCILPGNFTGARAHIGTNPTATTTLDVAKNGSNVGTIVISTAGVFTFATTSGAAVVLAPGDRITVTNQASADSTAADFGVSLALDAYIVGTIVQTQISMGFFYPGVPGNNQLIWKFLAPHNFTLPANFVASYGNVGTNPTATATLTVSLNGATIGTLSISTGGVFTFATTGGAIITVDAGDLLQVTAQASADATLANIGATFLGTLT